jgi:hypothetical protein
MGLNSDAPLWRRSVTMTIRNARRVAGALTTVAALSACAAPQWENPELSSREAQKAAYATATSTWSR